MNCNELELEEIHIYTSDQKLKWWGYGEWIEEPDQVNFEYEEIKCKIKRIFFPDGRKQEDGTYHIFGGHLCGYISIPKNHKFFGKNFYDIEIEVHGGLTYANIEEDEFWIGFDCAHSMDYVPSMEFLRKKYISDLIMPIPEEYKDHPLFKPIYRNIFFCIQECKSMADQVKLTE